MAKLKKYFIVDQTVTQVTSYDNFATKTLGMTKARKIADADLLIFTGGSDVSPSLYGEDKHRLTGPNESRDKREIEVFVKGLELEIPMLGICRGAQFLTVMSGGKLIQHVDNHSVSGLHLISTYDGNVFEITSTHHQMMFPFNMSQSRYKILAWATKPLSNVYSVAYNSSTIRDRYDNAKMPLKSSDPTISASMKKERIAYGYKHKIDELIKLKEFENSNYHAERIEPEIVFYPETNCFCIQGHPETLLFTYPNLEKQQQWIKKNLFNFVSKGISTEKTSQND